MKSIFTERQHSPGDLAVKKALGATYKAWQSITAFTQHSYPGAIAGWYYSGEKYGWNFRISDKKRVLVYLLPRDGFFKVAFVFGQKAVDAMEQAGISATILAEIKNARPYAEGRGIRLEVKSSRVAGDIKKLIGIKIAH
jgi:hypothetical protein